MKNLSGRRQRWMRVRVGILAVLLYAGAGAVIYRAYDLQVHRADSLREMAEEQYLRDIKLAPKRGTIYDRHGAEIAVSVDVDSVWANPRRLRKNGHSPDRVAARLAALLGVDFEVVRRRLSSNRYFVWIKRHVSPAEGKAVRSLDLGGLSISQEAKRFYPNSQLAAHVVGFANIDGKGIEGLELSYDALLTGSTESVPAIRDRRGVVVYSQQLLDDRASRGDDLTLTIDKTIQHIAERELELTVRTFEARAGSIVVMDPNTGELLAIANYPTFNPNTPGAFHSSHRRNRAITDRFEPGSTIKPFTVAGALAAGAIRSNQLIDCEGGEMEVAGDHTIHDSHKWDQLTPSQILVHSSNIGTAKIGLAMGRPALYRTLRRFGFGRLTGLGLPGETKGQLRHFKKWYDMDAVTISFGQAMSASALQLVVAMGAIANGGKLMQPMLVKRVTDATGQVVQESLPRMRRRVLPRRVARLVSDMLIGVTGADGTAPEAAIEGYLVAGKTGTAQKADYVKGGYAKDKWVSSFVGYAPAHRPRLVVGIAIDEPVIAHYGGTVAAPAFRRVVEASLRHLGVAADHGAGSLAAHLKERRRLERAAAKLLAEAGGAQPDPEPVVADLPEPPEGMRRVPELIGHTARAAVVAAEEADLHVKLEGTGLAVSQDPAAFEIVERGSVLYVVLAPPYTEDGPVGELPRKHAATGGTGRQGAAAARAELARAPKAAGGHDG